MPKSILTDRTVFEEGFVPEKIIAREAEIAEFVRCLTPVSSGDYTVNIYLYGQPGVGKTLICKTVLETHFTKQFVYVDCFEDSTKHDIMEQVMAQMGIFVHGRPSSREMMKRLKKSKKKFLLCLDRCELLKDPEIIEAFVINGCGLVLISNKPLAISKLALSGNDKLYLDEIGFRPYSSEDVFRILKERVQCGVAPNTINDKLLSTVCAMSEGDARRALNIVKLAARNAEILDKGTVSIENVMEAAKQTRTQVISKRVEKLTDGEKIIFDVLKDNKRMTSGNLFRIYRELSNGEVSDRCYRQHMVHLRDLGLVKEIGVSKGRIYEIA